jgi:hypothetical protein
VSLEAATAHGRGATCVDGPGLPHLLRQLCVSAWVERQHARAEGLDDNSSLLGKAAPGQSKSGGVTPRKAPTLSLAQQLEAPSLNSWRPLAPPISNHRRAQHPHATIAQHASRRHTPPLPLPLPWR